MSRTVIIEYSPNGSIRFTTAESHQVAFSMMDPFLWLLPGEPEGSLLFSNPEDDEEDFDPPTLRNPIG